MDVFGRMSTKMISLCEGLDGELSSKREKCVPTSQSVGVVGDPIEESSLEISVSQVRDGSPAYDPFRWVSFRNAYVLLELGPKGRRHGDKRFNTGKV